MIYWITGRKNAGKTTVARHFAAWLHGNEGHPVILDGDEVRDYLGGDYTDQGREIQVRRIMGFAAILEKQGYTPICACLSPYRSVREGVYGMGKQVIEVYVKGGELWEGTTYEEPENPDMIVEVNYDSERSCTSIRAEVLGDRVPGLISDRFTDGG